MVALLLTVGDMAVAVCGLRQCPQLSDFKRGRAVRKDAKPAIGYIACYGDVIIQLLIFSNYKFDLLFYYRLSQK